MPTLAAIDATPAEVESLCAAAGKPVLSLRPLTEDDAHRRYARLTLPGEKPEKKPRETSKCKRVEVTPEVYDLLQIVRERIAVLEADQNVTHSKTIELACADLLAGLPLLEADARD